MKLCLAFHASRGRGNIPLSHLPPWATKAALQSSFSSCFPLKIFGPDKPLLWYLLCFSQPCQGGLALPQWSIVFSYSRFGVQGLSGFVQKHTSFHYKFCAVYLNGGCTLICTLICTCDITYERSIGCILFITHNVGQFLIASIEFFLRSQLTDLQI